MIMLIYIHFKVCHAVEQSKKSLAGHGHAKNSMLGGKHENMET